MVNRIELLRSLTKGCKNSDLISFELDALDAEMESMSYHITTKRDDDAFERIFMYLAVGLCCFMIVAVIAAVIYG